MENTSFLERYLTPIAVLVGALILALAYVYGHGTTAPSPTGAQPAAVAVDIKNVKTDNDPYIGDVNAPVTIALWFDYQCPFCKQFDSATVTQIYKDYIQAGKVKIVFKDYQFLGQDSDTAALFARAVWALYPAKFYPWYQAMFAAQDAEGDQGFGDLASIETLTKTIPGIDVDKVVALMNDKKADFTVAIAADRAEGSSLGINGTPAVIIGTHLLAGAQPYLPTGAPNETPVKPLIDAELAK